jgi:hypothetical protein
MDRLWKTTYSLEYGLQDPDHASRRQQNEHNKYLLRVYSVEILMMMMMMDSGHVRNM